MSFLSRYCNENQAIILQDSSLTDKIYWLGSEYEESRKEILLPKRDQVFHSRTSPDFMPSSLLGVNVSELFSLVVQLAMVGKYIDRKKGTPNKSKKVAEMILAQMDNKDHKNIGCEQTTEISTSEISQNILSEWIFENLAQYREDRSKKIDGPFITIFPFHTHIPTYWGVKEAKRVEKLLLQLLSFDDSKNGKNEKIFDLIKELLEDSKTETVGIIGKALLLAIDEKMDEIDTSDNTTKKKDSTSEEIEIQLGDPFCTIQAKQMQEDLIHLLEYSEAINKETIIKWFYSLLSSHLAIYILRQASFFQVFVDTIMSGDFKSKSELIISSCNNCKLDSTTIYKCPFHPVIYPKLDGVPVVHKASRYTQKCKEDEITIKNLSIGLILFNHLRKGMNIFYNTKNKLYSPKSFFEFYVSDKKFRKFIEVYFGLLVSKYLDISNTIERKEEFYQELMAENNGYARNIKLFYGLVSNHYTNVKPSKDSRKHFFDFYRNMSYSASNGFLLKRRGVGSYYSMTDTYIQVLTQLATRTNNMIIYDEFIRFLENRSIRVSYVENPDNIENRTLKETLTKLGLFYGASDAKEAQFVYSLVF